MKATLNQLSFLSALSFGLQRRSLALATSLWISLLVACSSTPERPAPTTLADISPSREIPIAKPVWTNRLSESGEPMAAKVDGINLLVALTDGQLVYLSGVDGKILWRFKASAPLSSEPGIQNQTVAVVTRGNELILVREGKLIWKKQLTAQVLTAPLVAGGRVFVQSADRSVTAFDGSTGHKLWTQQRAGEPLVLSRSGVLLPFEDTLLVGFSGRLVGLNPSLGLSRWDVALANPRGTNDIERLVDLVGEASRVGDSVCVRSFQMSVGCVDARKGVLVWSRNANGHLGLVGDAKTLWGVESDGRIIAWSRDEGSRLWVSDALRFRDLTAPALFGEFLLVGDLQGWVHFINSSTGALVNRVQTDGAALRLPPVRLGDFIVVVGKTGQTFAFKL